MDATTAIVLALSAAAFAFFAWRRRSKPGRPDAPPDTVLVFQFARGPRCPSVSPFPFKLETFLRMGRVRYTSDFSGRMSVKGKIPWMIFNGKEVADSQLCIEYLKDKLDIDLNGHLSPEQVATARAFLKLTEENLYWTMAYELFVCQGLAGLRRVLPYTGLKFLATGIILTWVIKLELWGHGIGRHSDAEIWDIARRDMLAISNFLGNKPFMMGDQPSEVDCAVFGMLAQIQYNMSDTRHKEFMTSKLPNLVDYIQRMRGKFWPDWEELCTASPKFQDDTGKIYGHQA